MEHTEGPWRYDENPHIGGCRQIEYQFRDGGSWNWAELACTAGLPNDEEDKANAYLIAKAPEQEALIGELVEVCGNSLIEFTDFLAQCSDREVKDSFQGFADEAKALKAVIAKTEGR